MGPPCRLILYQHSFAGNFRLDFGWGLRTPNLGEQDAVSSVWDRGRYRSKERGGVPIGSPPFSSE